MDQAADIDVAVFGGGIAGLWLLARLRALGFDALLFENTALGSGQTIASQGIIHSGVKYTFDGVSRPQAESLSSMPELWMNCIAGRGEVDLRGARVLAETQLMFTTGGLRDRVAGAVATKALKGDVRKLDRHEFPEIFRRQEFRGQIYRLAEPVLAIHSVIFAFKQRFGEFMYCARVKRLNRENGRITEIEIGEIAIRPRFAVFTAGSGNEWFADKLELDKNKVTQRRPLRMFLVRGVPHKLFAHCLVPKPKPRVTVTTHECGQENIWYLGGNIAEESVGMRDADALTWAHKEMTHLFPWIDWQRKLWSIHDVDRAEPAANKLLPSEPTITASGNGLLAWPTKLSLAPALAAKTIRWIEQQAFAPSHKSTALPLPSVEVAKYPWDEKREWIRI